MKENAENSKMKDVQLVVLIGEAATRLAPLTYGLPKGLLSINQKPGLFNMINDFVKQGLNDITFILNHSNQRIVRMFFENAFPETKFNFVVEKSARGPMYAFMKAKPYITKPTLLLLGDTECETDFNYNESWLGYKEITDNSHSRWCLINTDKNGYITDFIDKPDYIPQTNKALIGLYFFKNPTLLKESLSQNYECDGQLQLSAGISYYLSKEKINSQIINNWRDAGALNTYADMFKSPYKYNKNNTFKTDNLNNITKTSNSTEIIDEINFLTKVKKMPISEYFPIINKVYKSGYSMGFIDLLSSYEYLNYYPMREWCHDYIFQRIIDSLKVIHTSGNTSKNIYKQCLKEYIVDFNDAISKLESNKYFALEEITINGVVYKGIKSLKDDFNAKLKNIIKNCNNFSGVVHNNCFISNILYATRSGMCKFLSPRGNFGVNSIYGDTRIDFAYLVASHNGNYEKIKQNVVYLSKTSKNGFDVSTKMREADTKILESVLKSNGIDVEDCKILAIIILVKKASSEEDFNKQCCLLASTIKMMNEICK